MLPQWLNVSKLTDDFPWYLEHPVPIHLLC